MLTNPKAIEMMQYLEYLKSKPEAEQKAIAHKSLIDAGLIDQNGEFTDHYTYSRDYYSKMTKYSAKKIAEWFLSHNLVNVYEKGAEEISNLKLQKLLYYAQGSYLSLYDSPLFSEPIIAWRYGPAIKDVYDRYKIFRNAGIEIEDIELPIIDKDTENILEQVYDIFGQYSAWKLCDMTHEETPWSTTELNEEITQEKIKKYFLEHYIAEEDKEIA